MRNFLIFMLFVCNVYVQAAPDIVPGESLTSIMKKIKSCDDVESFSFSKDKNGKPFLYSTYDMFKGFTGSFEKVWRYIFNNGPETDKEFLLKLKVDYKTNPTHVDYFISIFSKNLVSFNYNYKDPSKQKLDTTKEVKDLISKYGQPVMMNVDHSVIKKSEGPSWLNSIGSLDTVKWSVGCMRIVVQEIFGKILVCYVSLDEVKSAASD